MIDVCRLVLDFGVSVFLWTVHLVTTASFLWLEGRTLVEWHHKYLDRIMIIITPLYPLQLFVIGLQIYQEQSLYTLGSLALVASCWIHTFIYIVPLQHKITSAIDLSTELRKKLYFRSWYRAIVPFIIFVWSFIEILFLKTT